jgi:glycosyltransferase involved in cell wall biosynthesis
MNILIVHNTLNDSRSVSGALRHFLYMSEVWNEMGHPTDYLCARCGFPQIGSMAPKSTLISSDGLFDATRYLRQTWRYFPAYGYRMLSSHATRLPRRYDVVIASSQVIFEVYPALVIAKRQGARLSAKVHHVLHSQEKRTGLFDRLFLWSERQSTRWLNRHAGLVFCGNPFVEQDYHKLEKSLGLAPGPSSPTGYGVDLTKFPDSTDFQKPYDVVHLGRLHEHKGVLQLAQVWKMVCASKPVAKLLVIGEGPHRPAVEQSFRDAGLWENVRFTGGIPEKEKDELICQSKIGLSLSFEEGWGLSVNEYLAAGLPVVAYALPIFDVVFPTQLDQVPSSDPAAAAQAVLKWLNAPAERKAAGLRGREFAMRYDYRNVARTELAGLEAMVTSGR